MSGRDWSKAKPHRPREDEGQRLLRSATGALFPKPQPDRALTRHEAQDAITAFLAAGRQMTRLKPQEAPQSRHGGKGHRSWKLSNR